MANSVAPDETARDEASHLDLHCLERYPYWSVGMEGLFKSKYTERKKKRRVNFIPKFHSSLRKFVKYFTMITKRYMYGRKVPKGIFHFCPRMDVSETLYNNN